MAGHSMNRPTSVDRKALEEEEVETAGGKTISGIRAELQRLAEENVDHDESFRRFCEDLDRQLRDAQPAVEAACTQARAERDEARYSPMGDNHHNAAACPHCNPEYAEHGRKVREAQTERDDALAKLAAQPHDTEAVEPTSVDREKLEVPQGAVDAAVKQWRSEASRDGFSGPPIDLKFKHALAAALPAIYDQAVQDYREKLLGEVVPELEWIALYGEGAPVTARKKARALLAALASVEEAEEDCKPKASDWIPCGGTGLKTWAATGNTVPTFLCPGCPDCGTGKKPVGEEAAEASPDGTPQLPFLYGREQGDGTFGDALEHMLADLRGVLLAANPGQKVTIDREHIDRDGFYFTARVLPYLTEVQFKAAAAQPVAEVPSTDGEAGGHDFAVPAPPLARVLAHFESEANAADELILAGADSLDTRYDIPWRRRYEIERDTYRYVLKQIRSSSTGEVPEASGENDRAAACFTGGPLDETGGVVDLSYAPIHLALPWERGSYVFTGTEGDGDGGWLNYEWRPLGGDADFPDGPQALIALADPARELRRIWDDRVRFLLERAEKGIDADAEDLRRLLDGVDHPAATTENPSTQTEPE